MYKIKYKHILFPYSVIIITLILTFLDQIFFNSSIKNYLPTMPEDLLIYALFMGYPHIFASFFSLFDKEYYKEYKNKLNYGIPLVLIFTISMMFLKYEYTMLILIIITSYHIVRQYIGINKILFKTKIKYVEFWTWLNIILVSIYYILSGYEANFKFSFNLSTIGLFFVILFILFGIYYLIKIKNIKAKILFLLNIVALLVSVYFFYTGYIFFAILIPRFIHDVTAFIFYINHDSNRKKLSNSNILYKYVKNNIFYISFFLILISVILNYIFTFIEYVLIFLLFINYLHYYIESFIWKNNTIHRKTLELDF